MFSGDNLTVLTFCLGTAIVFGLEAMKGDSAAKRATFWIISGGCVLTGVFWLQLKEHLPSFSEHVQTVATNPMAWFIVVMFGLAVFAFQPARKSERPLSVVVQPIAAARVSPPETRREPETVVAPAVSDDDKGPDEREFIDVTPQYLLGLRRTPTLTQLQISRLLEPHLRKWIKITALIDDIMETGVALEVPTDEQERGIKSRVVALVDTPLRPRLHNLQKGTEISVIGQIEGVYLMEIFLEHSEIL
jgi:hypothetical protein